MLQPCARIQRLYLMALKMLSLQAFHADSRTDGNAPKRNPLPNCDIGGAKTLRVRIVMVNTVLPRRGDRRAVGVRREDAEMAHLGREEAQLLQRPLHRRIVGMA